MTRVLVVDDDPLVRSAMTLALRRGGHEVLEASNGQQALKTLGESPVDLVISDILMPEMDGIGLIREIRKLHPDLRILSISGGSRVGPVDYLQVAEKLGAHRVLPKPFTHSQLLAAVAETMALSGPATDPTELASL